MNDVRSLARESDAWPFVEARRILDRIGGVVSGQGPRAARDRLRTVGSAAHRHLRRGGAHHHDPARVPHAVGRAGAPGVLLRRHGRPAQGAGQRAQPRAAGAASRQAAHRRARPVRHPSELRPAQQRAAARLPRPVRLRVRVPVGHRLLSQWTFRRRAARSVASSRPHPRRGAADPGRRAAADLLAVPADRSQDRDRAAGAGARARRRGRHHHLRGRRGRAPDASRSPAAGSSASGRSTGRCAGTRSMSTTRCRART